MSRGDSGNVLNVAGAALANPGGRREVGEAATAHLWGVPGVYLIPSDTCLAR